MKWIRTKDRLPEVSTRVIVSTPRREISVGELLPSGEGGWLYLTKTSQLYNDVSNEFYGFLQELYNSVDTKEERKALPRDIITLRKMFYRDKN